MPQQCAWELSDTSTVWPTMREEIQRLAESIFVRRPISNAYPAKDATHSAVTPIGDARATQYAAEGVAQLSLA
jgi:hypothetical protein